MEFNLNSSSVSKNDVSLDNLIENLENISNNVHFVTNPSYKIAPTFNLSLDPSRFEREQNELSDEISNNFKEAMKLPKLSLSITDIFWNQKAK